MRWGWGSLCYVDEGCNDDDDGKLQQLNGEEDAKIGSRDV